MQDTDATNPDQKLGTNMTELKLTTSQKTYLSAIFNKKNGQNFNHILYLHTNDKFASFRRSEQTTGVGNIPLHNDKGFKYADCAFQKPLRSSLHSQYV